MRLHVNGLFASVGEVGQIYSSALGPADTYTSQLIRTLLFERWPEADKHIVHLHWIDHLAGSSLPRAIRQLVSLFVYLVLLRVRGARIVWTVHNLRAHESVNGRSESAGQNLLFLFAHVVHCPNAATYAALDERRLLPRSSKLRHVPLPIAEGTVIGRAEARAQLGLASSAFILLCFGNLRDYKGVDLVQEAVARLDGLDPSVHLVIAGTCFTPELQQGIEERATDQMSLELGRQSADQFDRLFSACDYSVLFYRSGDNSGVLTAGFGMGVPAIVSDLPGLLAFHSEFPDAVVSVPREDVSALTEAIRELAAAPHERHVRARAAARDVATVLGDGLGKRYRELYEAA